LEKSLADLSAKASRRKWPEGLHLSEENFAALASWACIAQVTQNRISYSRHERITLGFMLLGAAYTDRFLLPVDVFQTEPSHLTASQSVNDNEQQHGMIANISRSVPGGPGQKALHITPLRTLRQTFQLVNVGRVDGVNQAGYAPMPGLRKPEEGA
jgi:hypothetical protein